MRILLPILESDLRKESFVPLAPYLIVEQEGKVALYTPGYFFAIPKSRLDDVTLEDIRNAMQLSHKENVHLPAIRELPTEDLASQEVLKMIRDWWIAEAAELRKRMGVAGVV